MSKFRNRIRDLGRAPAGFGFPALTRPQSTRHMLVVAEVEEDVLRALLAGAGDGGVMGVLYGAADGCGAGLCWEQGQQQGGRSYH